MKKKPAAKPTPSQTWWSAILDGMREANDRGEDATWHAQSDLETIEEYLLGERDLPLTSRLTRAEFERLVVKVAYECMEWSGDAAEVYTVLLERFDISLTAREAVEFERASEWYPGIADDNLYTEPTDAA